MIDIKEIKTAVQQIAETRQLSEESLWSAIEIAFATAYKREYGKIDQVIRARVNKDSGEINFSQVKQVVEEDNLLGEDEMPKEEDETRVRFNPERHIMINDAQLVRQGVTANDEISFPLEVKTEFGRIAAQSARQAVTQKIHEAEKDAAISEFQGKEGTLVHGQVQRIERGNVFVDLGRTVAILPFSEQIRGERFKQGDTIRVYIQSIDTTRRSGGFVRLSRANTQFVVRLFEMEVPELAEGVLEVKAIARDPGIRTKIAVESKDSSVDPVGAFVGQRGMRVMTVKSELGGEQVDIINWSENAEEFVAESLLPAEVMKVTIDKEGNVARVKTNEEQIPVVIGRGGQNLKLAAQLTGLEIVILNENEEEVARVDTYNNISITKKEIPMYESRGDEEDTNEEVSEDTENIGGDTEPEIEENGKNSPVEETMEEEEKEKKSSE